jgi:hypothetical protein
MVVGLTEGRKNSYVFVPVLARPGFGLLSALGTVPLAAAGFFLSALGFLGSRLLLFCPFAIAVLHLAHQRAVTNNKPTGNAPAIETNGAGHLPFRHCYQLGGIVRSERTSTNGRARLGIDTAFRERAGWSLCTWLMPSPGILSSGLSASSR